MQHVGIDLDYSLLAAIDDGLDFNLRLGIGELGEILLTVRRAGNSLVAQARRFGLCGSRQATAFLHLRSGPAVLEVYPLGEQHEGQYGNGADQQ